MAVQRSLLAARSKFLSSIGSSVILELADLRIKPGLGSEFESAIGLAIRNILSQAHGLIGTELRRSIEFPDRYLLLVSWDSVDSHMVTFRGSAVYGKWRAAITPFFAAAPQLEHFELVRLGEDERDIKGRDVSNEAKLE